MKKKSVNRWYSIGRLLPLHSVMFVGILFLSYKMTLAQAVSPDLTARRDTAYEAQRLKVNELLKQRSARFGQFEQSLSQRTGIFGLKTKKDMQSSIDILKQIVLTDNEIFKETKELVDFKDFEKTKIAERASEFDNRINGYIKTISKLQQEQERLRQEIESLQYKNQMFRNILLLIVAVFIISILYFMQQRKKLTKT